MSPPCTTSRERVRGRTLQIINVAPPQRIPSYIVPRQFTHAPKAGTVTCSPERHALDIGADLAILALLKTMVSLGCIQQTDFLAARPISVILVRERIDETFLEQPDGQSGPHF